MGQKELKEESQDGFYIVHLNNFAFKAYVCLPILLAFTPPQYKKVMQ